MVSGSVSGSSSGSTSSLSNYSVAELKEMLQNGEITQAEYNAEIKSRYSSEESNNSEENSSSDNVAKTEGEAE